MDIGNISKPRSVDEIVTSLICEVLWLDDSTVQKNSNIKDLGATPAELVTIRQELMDEFEIEIPAKSWKQGKTVGDAIQCVRDALEKKRWEEDDAN